MIEARVNIVHPHPKGRLAIQVLHTLIRDNDLRLVNRKPEPYRERDQAAILAATSAVVEHTIR